MEVLLLRKIQSILEDYKKIGGKLDVDWVLDYIESQLLKL